jgi:hypothetical protein
MTEDRSPSGGSDWRAVVIAAAITAVVGAIATVSAALIGHQQGTHDAPPGRVKTVIRYKAWAPCPSSGRPMALLADSDAIASPPGLFRGQLGAAHIDNVIAPDGSATVAKREKVCVTITKYPARDRRLWLILRLRLPPGHHPTYQLFYAVGEFDDPVPGRYAVSIDRSCTAEPAGSRHTLLVVSAPGPATKLLWKNYNARIRSNCNPAFDKYRHVLPPATFRVSNQGDVIQH